MERAFVNFVTKDGSMVPNNYVCQLVKALNSEGIALADFTMGGSDYNRPKYLLEKIHEHPGEALILAVGDEEVNYKAMIFVEKPEMDMLVAALEKAGDEENAWDICKRIDALL